MIDQASYQAISDRRDVKPVNSVDMVKILQDRVQSPRNQITVFTRVPKYAFDYTYKLGDKYLERPPLVDDDEKIIAYCRWDEYNPEEDYTMMRETVNGTDNIIGCVDGDRRFIKGEGE